MTQTHQLAAATNDSTRARDLLVDYLTGLTAESIVATPFTGNEIEQLLEVRPTIVTVFDDAAARTGTELVRASGLSGAAARLGAAEPFPR